MKKYAILLIVLCECFFAAQSSAISPASNPILVVGETSRFGEYIGEILRAEGFNEFQIESPSDPGITPVFINNFDIVILGETSLTSNQKEIYANYVNGGGNLIALRPDKQLADVFGLTDATGVLENAYISINASTDIGAGLNSRPLQLHCSADRYNLNKAVKIAALYVNDSYPSNYPGVTFNNYGSGHAIAMTYNLAKNIVLTRQGNWQLAGREKDGMPGIRPTDMFTDGWVNTTNNTVNQADEQMRLLTHCIEKMSTYTKPLPRFWYFPDKLKCLVTATIDGEESTDLELENEFKDFEAKGAKASLYILFTAKVSYQFTDSWTSRGHEIAGHPDDTGEAANPTWGKMNSAISSKKIEINKKYGLPMLTNVNHWFVWCGKDTNGNPNFAAEAMIEADNGIEMDINYAHYDYNSTQGRFLGSLGNDQGNFTGSGLVMKFADINGKLLNIYQHLNNVYDQQYMQSKDPTRFTDCFQGLMWRSLNREAYSYICIKAHRNEYFFSRDPLMKMLDYANNNRIPVWTALKLLNFLKMKDEAAFKNISWSNSQLSFTVNSSLTHSNGLTFMVPASILGGAISGVTLNGTNALYATMTVKGKSYALVTVSGGSNYQVVVTTSGSHVPVTGITVNPVSAAIYVNAVQQLTATVTPKYATNQSVVWSSGNASIAAVDANGLVTGAGPGSTTITATAQDGNLTANCAIRISSPPTPSAVADLNASRSNNSAVLSWSAPANATGYKIYRGTDAYFNPSMAFNTVTSPGFIDTDVLGNPSVNFYYFVTATNSDGESGRSNRVGKFDFDLITTPKTDFNEIALALNLPGVTNAQQLMAAVPSCNSVARWNASLQGYEQYIPGIPPTNFAVQMGYPYYVNVTSKGIFTLLGVLTAPTFNLITTPKTDFNEVMLPLNKTGIVKASQLMSDIPNCNSVARWNASMQGYEQYIPGIPPTDFVVKAGYPYYVNVTANVTWPSGGTPKASVAENVIAGQTSGTKAPHAVYGKRDPSVELTGFTAYVTSRPEDRLTEISPNCGIVQGYWIVQCASFQAPWDKGETVRVEFPDNQGNISGFTDVKLTYEPHDMAGMEATQKPESTVTSCELFQNYPNPFNPSTNIPYQLDQSGRVRILIYNMMGQEVRRLVDEIKESGAYEACWDGKDDRNSALGDGIYFIRMEAKGKMKTRKLLLIQ